MWGKLTSDNWWKKLPRINSMPRPVTRSNGVTSVRLTSGHGKSMWTIIARQEIIDNAVIHRIYLVFCGFAFGMRVDGCTRCTYRKMRAGFGSKNVSIDITVSRSAVALWRLRRAPCRSWQTSERQDLMERHRIPLHGVWPTVISRDPDCSLHPRVGKVEALSRLNELSYYQIT